MPIIAYILLFVFGAIVGSFLNVVILRLKISPKTGKASINLKGRSKCPHCGKTLSLFELIPLVSFLIQGGRCAQCQAKISWQYPAVELLSGILTLLPFYYLGFANPLAYFGVLILYLLLVIAVYDLKFCLVPDIILAILFFLILIFDIIKLSNQEVSLANLALGAILGGVLFFLLVYFSRERWMGWGDVKLGFILGLLLPYPFMIVCLVLAFIIGALVSLVLIYFKRAKLKSEIPFAPFLVLAAVIALFWGREIINWYLRGF